MCERGWIILTENPSRSHSKRRIHVNQIPATRVPEHLFKITVDETRDSQPGGAFFKHGRRRHRAAARSAIRYVEFPGEIGAVDPVKTKTIEINKPSGAFGP